MWPGVSETPPQVCPGVSRCIQVSPGVSRCVQVSPGVLRCISGVPRCVQVYPRCPQVCPAVPTLHIQGHSGVEGQAGVGQGHLAATPRYPQVCQGPPEPLPRCTQVYPSCPQVCPGVSRCVQVCLAVPTLHIQGHSGVEGQAGVGQGHLAATPRYPQVCQGPPEPLPRCVQVYPGVPQLSPGVPQVSPGVSRCIRLYLHCTSSAIPALKVRLELGRVTWQRPPGTPRCVRDPQNPSPGVSRCSQVYPGVFGCTYTAHPGPFRR
ncbi:uncharacterized protein LOC131574018 [Poecile atricapillus]|uniref:uncharacterized protein LOC131574018 n=1 Tax=Poecile atricapillus TaxID=48891 RepID=UPI00273923C8|nr:uncharacterized protein LOC131574018 [Poecile atricapillus]